MAEAEEEEQTLFIERYPRRKHPLLYQKQPKEPSPPLRGGNLQRSQDASHEDGAPLKN